MGVKVGGWSEGGMPMVQGVEVQYEDELELTSLTKCVSEV